MILCGICFSETAWVFVDVHDFWSSRTLKNRIEASPEAAERASSIPLLLCHGKGAYLCLS